MKILQMIDIPWDSGLAHYALSLSQGLKRAGHKVFISAVPGERPWKKAQLLGLRTLPLVSFKGLRPLRQFIEAHQIDVLNAHTGSSHSLAVAAGLGQKVAVVRTRSDARQVKRRVGARFLYKHTHKVIAAADYIREGFVKTLRLPPRQVVTIYQGIDVPAFPLKPLPAKPVLGIVARLDPVKGHRYLLEALSILLQSHPQLQVRIIGQEENVKMRQLKEIADRLRIENHVDFLGFQPDVPAAMAGCRIGVIASTGSEAVSRAALEWMAAGRPVVSTNVGCLPELIEGGKTGVLVDPKDAPGLARALGQLLRKPAAAEAMGKAGRRRVETRFALSTFVEATLFAYEQAIQRARS
jgi:glycosyltransferase involved in cell wall biosynthesis